MGNCCGGRDIHNENIDVHISYFAEEEIQLKQLLRKEKEKNTAHISM
jgi:hypothetical protein